MMMTEKSKTAFANVVASVLTDDAKRAIHEADWRPTSDYADRPGNSHRRADPVVDGVAVYPGACPIGYGLCMMGGHRGVISGVVTINMELEAIGSRRHIPEDEGHVPVHEFICDWDDGVLSVEDLKTLFPISEEGT